MDKPLKDWTLEEVMQYCKKLGFRCEGCILEKFCFGILQDKSPNLWDEYDGWNKTP